MEVISGVDWFELAGTAEFGDVTVSVPKLLRALKHGEETVRLDDGTFGIVPEEWMKKYRLLAELGTMEQNRIRFTRPQAGLLDALLAAEPVKMDAAFNQIRRELQQFAGVEPAQPPPGFTGELRHYQLEGLGWLLFLQRFGFGGCLADDMGLGKTVQVLALLESRRALRVKAGDAPAASLVVVPRSLVFHWKAEAARFTPKLRILDHTGALRSKPGDHFEDYDVVLTTYGTLRRDALHFKNQTFDYCILDEAQAIKNAGTLSAKAARLLKAKHRLAMSGTPVENHLGELWSLFEFLNPGMLGSASVFGAARQDASAATRSVLARALKPFILRRTKGEVARELPAKVEQTIFCDLKPPERKLYNELRDYYRTRLLKNNGEQPAGRVKFQALEALLRLRQAACHIGLIDKNKTGESSAKLETLFAQLEQVLEEGHKTLVFSQFTSLLALVRNRLDRDKIPYVYLDGKTRDREARVEQFQHDETMRIFLISLKAGGLGLNLHAAEYVYLLDPWWNPAVEAQAIDRAHRIGQTRQVFAYRLIARDTGEEKVLALQRTKRDLADAIITADNSLLQSLTREDLELLLS
jgi:SNF2 family DNA or RNA helicase